MKILLMGEYSNVHATLAKGLRKLGHHVTVLSNGDFWKNYPRDIDLVRKPGKLGGIMYMMKLYTIVHKLRGYDIVQLINPMFLELKAECIFPIYQYLRKHNKKVILGGFGMDYYWVSVCCKDKPLRYSDFNIGDKLRTNTDALKERKDWLGTEKGRLNQMIAEDCDGIITGLYEYWACYQPSFPQKTTFIPFPIKPQLITPGNSNSHTYVEKHQVIPLDIPKKVKLFIGINGSKPKYSVSLIIPKSDNETVNRVKAAIQAAYAEGVTKLKGNGRSVPTLSAIKTPLRDGDMERPRDEAYKGCYFVNANSSTAPGIVDASCQPILERSEVYSGVYGRASINFYAYNSNGSRGIACGLNNLQKISDGAPLGGKSRAQDDFVGLGSDDDFLK